MSTNPRSILDYFPYDKGRDVQEELLIQLQENWGKYDVFVINAPTALGKSAIAQTLMNWEGSAVYTTPTNQLLTQFGSEFPDTPRIYTKKYPISMMPSGTTPDDIRRGSYAAFRTSGPIACTAAFFAVMKKVPHQFRLKPRRVTIMDEAHTIIPLIQDQGQVAVWKHKTGYPDKWQGPDNKAAVLAWAERHCVGEDKLGAFAEETIRTLTSLTPKYVLTEIELPWSAGAKWLDPPVVRGEEVMLPCLALRPVQIQDLESRENLVGGKGEGKLVLMSATISSVDLNQLGLTRRRVLYLNCASPIPAERRPVYGEPVVAVTYANMEEATKMQAEALKSLYLPGESHHKGIIHATYGQARLLRCYLGDLEGRIIYHNKDDKQAKLQEFLDAPPSSGKVLVASGMYEGVDLPYDKARWQAILKIPWGSLADPAIKHMSELDPAWYIWETLKKVIQTCGRVVRTPTDSGLTIILDSTFHRLYSEGRRLAPSWWLDAVHVPADWR